VEGPWLEAFCKLMLHYERTSPASREAASKLSMLEQRIKALTTQETNDGQD
jgi:hypothetical protein